MSAIPSPHISQSRSIDPFSASPRLVKALGEVSGSPRTPRLPLYPRLSGYDPCSALAVDAVGHRAPGTGEMAAQIGDRVVRAEPVNQVLQWDQLAVAAFVTADVDTIVVIHDVLQGCRGVLLV